VGGWSRAISYLPCPPNLELEAIGLLGEWSPREAGAYASFAKGKCRQRGVVRETPVVTYYYYQDKWTPPPGMKEIARLESG
jgi:hypothetical protein